MKLLVLALACCCLFLAAAANQENEELRKRGIGTWIHKQFLYKGTKWCGPGHIAKTYNDLGKNRETDKCCREHDRHCKIRIKGLSKKYGLWNLSWKTASHCDCESKFKKCLDKVNNKASKGLTKIYFYNMEPRCIRLKTVTKKKCVKRSWGFCKKYESYKTKQAYYIGLHEAVGIED